MNSDPAGTFLLTGLIIGAIIGATIGFGLGVYADYKDDGEVFNGSIKWNEYVGLTLIGGAAGALAAYAAPAISSFLGSSFTIGSIVTASGGLAAISISGGQIAAAIGLAALFCSEER